MPASGAPGTFAGDPEGVANAALVGTLVLTAVGTPPKNVDWAACFDPLSTNTTPWESYGAGDAPLASGVVVAVVALAEPGVASGTTGPGSTRRRASCEPGPSARDTRAS